GKEVWTVKLPGRKPCNATPPAIEFTRDGKKVVTARNDEGLVRVFAASNGKQLLDFVYDTNLGGLTGAAIDSFGVSADSKQVVIHRYEFVDIAGLGVFDLETGKELARHRVNDKHIGVRWSAPSFDGRHLFYAKKNAVHMMDVKTGKEV